MTVTTDTLITPSPLWLVEPCWISAFPGTNRGYVRRYMDGRVQSEHARIYERSNGPVPKGMVIDHLCHTYDLRCPGGVSCIHRRCVNPAHMELVTRGENSRRGGSARKTHCPAGHPYNVENTYYTRQGKRRCRACNRAAQSRYWRRKHPR